MGFFRYVMCEGLFIADGYKQDKPGGFFGLDDNGNAQLTIYGDDGETPVAYLGENPNQNHEMNFYLKSKTDKRQAIMMIDENGGRFDSWNKMEQNVVRIAVADDGSGVVDLRDKFGYKR